MCYMCVCVCVWIENIEDGLPQGGGVCDNPGCIFSYEINEKHFMYFDFQIKNGG